MADLRRELLEEQFSDAALFLLMDASAEAEGTALLEDYEKSGVEIPEELDKALKKRIQTLYKETEKSALLRRTVYRAAKIAAAFAVFLVLSVNLILSVEAIRVPFLNLCIETQRYFSNLTFSSEKDTASNHDNDVVDLPIDIPSGYTLTVKQHNHDDYRQIYEDSILFLGYQDPDGHSFIFQTLPAAGSLSIDTQDADSTRFLLNGMQAIQIRQDSDNMLRTIWIDSNRQRLFDVSCNGMMDTDFEQHVLHMSAMFMAPELYAD